MSQKVPWGPYSGVQGGQVVVVQSPGEGRDGLEASHLSANQDSDPITTSALGHSNWV